MSNLGVRFFLRVACFGLCVVAFSSCRLLMPDIDQGSSAGNAEVSLSLSATSEYADLSTLAASRTVMPSTSPSISSYELWGALSGGTQAKLATYTSLTGATIVLASGTWDFTLKALNTASSPAVFLTGSKMGVVLAEDPVSLAFVLVPLSSGNGNVSITLDWSTSGQSISTAWYKFYEVTGTAPTSFTAISSTTLSSGTLTFSKTGVAAGTYLVVFQLGSSLSYISEAVRVYPEMASSKTISLTASDFNKAPTVPTSVVLTYVSSPNSTGSISLSWQDNADNEIGVRLAGYYGDGSLTISTGYTNVLTPTTSYSATTLTRGKTLYYTLTVFNAFADASAVTSNTVTIPYLVSYSADGGSTVYSTVEVAPSGTVGTLPTSPKKTGYTFGGWYTGTNGTGTAFTASTVVTANKTLYAKWTLNTYTITYSLGSGTNSSSNPSTYTYESSAITFADPTRTGCTFKGWYTDVACTTAITGIAAGSTGNYTLYAKWSVVPTYTVTFDANGGTTSASTMVVDAGYYPTALPTATRTGYKFAGWFLTAYADNTLFTETIPSGVEFTPCYPVTADVTVHAYWCTDTYVQYFFKVTTSSTATDYKLYGTLTLPYGTSFKLSSVGQMDISTFSIAFYTNWNAHTVTAWYWGPICISDSKNRAPTTGLSFTATAASYTAITLSCFCDNAGTTVLQSYSVEPCATTTLATASAMGVSAPSGTTFVGWSRLSGSAVVEYADGATIPTPQAAFSLYPVFQ